QLGANTVGAGDQDLIGSGGKPEHAAKMPDWRSASRAKRRFRVPGNRRKRSGGRINIDTRVTIGHRALLFAFAVRRHPLQLTERIIPSRSIRSRLMVVA